MTHLDPDPRHVPEDDLGVSSWERQRRAALRPARPWGCVVALLVWLAFWAVVITLVVRIVTPREAADPTTSRPSVSGATGSVRASAPVPVGTSGRPLLGAPPAVLGGSTSAIAPRPLAGGAGTVSAPAVVTGSATWYRWRPGQAAAGPRLRAALGSHWRGKIVRVCAAGPCVTVTLTDFMVSPHSLIDLDAGAFQRLAPLSAGVIRVTITLAGGPRPAPTPPPTDAGPVQ